MKADSAVIAAGHEATAHVAKTILENGGNAYDAIVAAFFAACVAEPILASVGGGGFLFSAPAQGPHQIYDFFCQTPMCQLETNNVHFFPIHADFGPATQTFHIGHGSIATPGVIKGIAEIHKDYASMPMATLLEPAIDLARNGVTVNAFQAYIFEIVNPILNNSAQVKSLFSRPDGNLLSTGDIFRNPDFSSFLQLFGKHGLKFFYEKDIAELIVQSCSHNGGYLQHTDLTHYQCEKRAPVKIGYHHCVVESNPPPSSGGLLMCIALKLLERQTLNKMPFGSTAHLQLLIDIMDQTNRARRDAAFKTHEGDYHDALSDSFLLPYLTQIQKHKPFSRGTTHISILDREGNCVGMTVSNGEGCGYLLDGTGIMLNNMLGEEDLNPQGFHQWQSNLRLTSMMAPSLLSFGKNHRIMLGSGGSNRIRTALLQVISNLVDFRFDLSQAIAAPRVHAEENQVNIESGMAPELNFDQFPEYRLWPDKNLYFGGVHAVEMSGARRIGAGDERRGGVVLYC